jgi:hypothetical protein
LTKKGKKVKLKTLGMFKKIKKEKINFLEKNKIKNYPWRV